MNTYFVATCSGDNLPTSDEWDATISAAEVTALELAEEHNKEVTIYEVTITPLFRGVRTMRFEEYDG